MTATLNYHVIAAGGVPRIEVYEGSQKIADVGLPEKKFKTGSVGYWASQKIEINGKRYQAQFQLVEIGTKQQTG